MKWWIAILFPWVWMQIEKVGPASCFHTFQYRNNTARCFQHIQLLRCKIWFIPDLEINFVVCYLLKQTELIFPLVLLFWVTVIEHYAFAQMLILVKVIRPEYQVKWFAVFQNDWLVLQSLQFVSSIFYVAGVSSSMPQSYVDPGCVQSVSGNNFASSMLLFAKTRKLSVERSDPRKYVLLFPFLSIDHE